MRRSPASRQRSQSCRVLNATVKCRCGYGTEDETDIGVYVEKEGEKHDAKEILYVETYMDDCIGNHVAALWSAGEGICGDKQQ